MDTRKITVFGRRFMLTMFLATFAIFAQAQEGTDDGLEPRVDTSAVDEFEPSVDTSSDIGPAVDTSAVIANEREEIEPQVPAAVLAADVTRQQTGADVMDRLELGRTEITGNQELPKVLYIVPWQKSDPGELMGRPVNTLLDEVLAPLDREEFIRQVDYYGDLYGEKQE
ncbi:MAG: hypothetical protein OER22_01565 [Gammaproteobacteria bacterium]|nr:hypothetical protein [Gammaproteobacteria bacterium]MDH3374340.1 hypothetical protein [Gammaproteobacteria bacterium]MDH3409884.1 hypothetical protein [Gammaproteobacteria bacterium]MDH3551281.1 hypothetical protein [Gammaproteobacteria bacterium]